MRPPRRLAALLLLALPAGCQRLYPPESRFALGPVEVTVRVAASSEAKARAATEAAFAAVSQVNNLLSIHLARSEVSQLNDAAGREVHLSGQTVAVLRRAAEISELSGGAFDVTAAPLIRLWKETIESRRLPDAASLEAAKGLVGYRRLTLGANSARLEPGMSVDLGGIAKGHAVDKAVEALKAEGVTSALIDAGGDGCALGTRPDGEPWRVGIQDPASEAEEALPRALLLSDAAYATSGDYRQQVEIDGVRYAHIVDPRTGEPARAAASVTVIAPDCTTADALATALTVLGPDEGLALVETLPDVECLVIVRGAGGLEATESSGFSRFVEP